MSKLAAAISYTLTGEKRIQDKPRMNYTDVSLNVSETRLTHRIETGIKVGVKFEKLAFVPDYSMSDTEEEIQQVLHDIKRAMIEEVFGEFRPIILEMRAALHDADKTKLRKLLVELENQMFVDGV